MWPAYWWSVSWPFVAPGVLPRHVDGWPTIKLAAEVASLDSVATAAAAAEQAQQALVAEVLAAVAAGVPKAAVARAAGVTRQTVGNWEAASRRP